ncbi:mannose-6-phosphate isomerase [Phlebotomus argentipes]|uniref:mannose-6-phosphate isomerase n=1 Tax=Phlebotomus argentipes TaxID=94469 RepID=UPI002892A16A|nr:mannose-6-phosphate isomerase [Phlebotomus argentipes]
MLNLLGTVKNYHWGKRAPQSLVYQLAELNCPPDKELDEKDAYAELWMGNHVMDPSLVKDTLQPLGEYLSQQPTEVVGDTRDLPFLLKVLSIETALSIQVHPNKKEAEELHKIFPDVYKDDNHKPEMSIALTPFLALCGFRPVAEIVGFLKKFPAVADLLGRENVQKLEADVGKMDHSEGLKACFTRLMQSSLEEIETTLQKTKSQLEAVLDRDDLLLKTFLTLLRDFPGDVGVLTVFLLHIVQLKPGEAMFISANEPHAYISGDCIECMACSDNVIRAGLTPKPKDIPTLIRMLKYQPQSLAAKIFPSQKLNGDEFVDVFSPPVPDFAVIRYRIPSGVTSHSVKLPQRGSVMLVLSGEAKLQSSKGSGLAVKRGSVVFLPGNAGETLNINLEASGVPFEAYQAMYNDF